MAAWSGSKLFLLLVAAAVIGAVLALALGFVHGLSLQIGPVNLITNATDLPTPPADLHDTLAFGQPVSYTVYLDPARSTAVGIDVNWTNPPGLRATVALNVTPPFCDGPLDDHVGDSGNVMASVITSNSATGAPLYSGYANWTFTLLYEDLQVNSTTGSALPAPATAPPLDVTASTILYRPGAAIPQLPNTTTARPPNPLAPIRSGVHAGPHCDVPHADGSGSGLPSWVRTSGLVLAVGAASFWMGATVRRR
jgi:hypothetical protein